MSKETNFLAGLLVGGVIGAAVTMIVLPDLDAETRQRLRERALLWRENAEKLLASAQAEAPAFVERAQESIDHLRARFSDAVDEARVAAAERTRELQGKFERALREGEAQL